MVRADLFSGFLAIWNALGFRIHFARPPIPSRAQRGEDRIPFELFLEYTANWENNFMEPINQLEQQPPLSPQSND
ncbi:MAG TPA: hypothetical protein VJC04_02680, partial [Candidatus Paceibacterota bacterium]